MKKVKKYYPGTSGLVYDNSKSVGVLAPQKEDPNKFSTGKFLFPEQKTLGKIVDRKVMSQDYLSSKGPSFMDKAGSFMGNYGDIIGSVGTSIASLINANKKQDPTGRPYKTGTNMIKSKKSKLIKYQDGTNAADIIGPGPLDNMEPSISPLTPKMASFKAPNQTPMTPKLNRIPMQKQSRRERKAENKKLEAMARAPITYNESSFVGPPQFVGPSDQELKLGKIREEAQSARNLYEGKQKGTPFTDALFKSVISSQAFKETMAPKKSLKTQYEENKGGYARALKSGKRNAQGNLVDPTTGLEYKDLRTKSSNKSSNQSSVPPAGQELVRMSRMGKNRENPFYPKSAGIPEPIKRNYPTYKDNSQLFRGTGRFKDGTKSLTKDEGKVGKGSEYFSLAKTLTPEQKTEFRKLDAQAKKEGKTFSFQGLKYDPAAYAAAMSKGKGASKGSAKADTPKKTQHTTEDAGKKMRNPAPISQTEGGGQYSNVDWSGKSGFEFRNPLESIARPLVRIGIGASSKGLAGVGAGLAGEIANVVADYTPKGTVNSIANNIQTMADAYNLYRGATKSSIDFKKLKPKEALEYVKNLWKNKVQMTGKPLPQMTKLGKSSAETTQLNLPI